MAFDLVAYRARIGLGEVSADLAGLRALQQAHLRTIPFENFDPLLGKVPAVDLAGIFAKIVDGRRGGYCFEQNSLFEAALKATGFSVRRTLARVRMRFGPEGGRSHLVLLVDVEGRRFLADAGFGGPGSLTPLALDTGEEQEVPNGTYRFVQDTERGEAVLERETPDGWMEVYAFDGARASDGEIAAANYVCATWDEAPFKANLLFGCYVGDTRYGLFNRALTIETPDGEERRQLTDFDEFARLIAGDAGVSLAPEALAAAWEKISAIA